jgi:hypothetical protein
MKWISPLFSDARNKLGGTIYARNRAGVYQRARVTPSNPQTAFQQANREMFSTIVQAWRALTGGQRLAWNNAAEGVTLTDSLGQTSMPSGFQLFTSRNRNRLLIDFTMLTDYVVAPADKLFCSWSPTLFFTSGGVADEMDWNVTGTFTVGQTFCLFGATGQLSPGINFVAPHLYRTLGFSDIANEGFEYSEPWSELYPQTVVLGQQVGSYVRLIDTASGFERARFTFISAFIPG